eukprot:TRINITY_DN362_c0_g1_i1.p1 TRINITY_DN362_c0_g1~~TRINITY_DN362_c0_g1_i1.p1  ORF type:complete len:249 (-),score=59.91 TRINITY_DN362_c0_g1_i1:287-1033(-)
MASRDKLVFLAKLAEEVERYDEMIKHVKALAQLGNQLTVDERNLLSVAYKNVIGSRRASWRVLHAIEQKEREKGEAATHVEQIETYKNKVEKELDEISAELLELLEKHLLPNDESLEGKVFYMKMAGDYHRYLAEFKAADNRTQSAENARKAYDDASKMAAELKPTDPIRLGLALNFSVFFYEIIGDQSEACTLAKNAFDQAIAELDDLREDQYKDATLILQLIRDNLTLWRTEEETEQDGTEVQDLE